MSRWLNNELVRLRSHARDWAQSGIIGPGNCSTDGAFDLEGRPGARLHPHAIAAWGTFVVINPGKGWPSKVWPAAGPQQWPAGGEIARSDARWWSGPEIGKAHLGRGDRGRLPRQDTRLFTRRVWANWRPLHNGQVCFIASDTGPLHLAAAVGTPCVGLFGPMPAERNGPYGPLHVAVQKRVLDRHQPPGTEVRGRNRWKRFRWTT